MSPAARASHLGSDRDHPSGNGRHSSGDSTAETIEELPQRVTALSAVGEAEAKAGDRGAARDTLQRAAAAASEIADPWTRIWPLIVISRASAAFDDNAATEELLKSVLAARSAIKDGGKRDQALVWICDVQMVIGAVAAARATAASIVDPSADADGAGRMNEVRNADGVVRMEPDASKSLGQHDGVVS